MQSDKSIFCIISNDSKYETCQERLRLKLCAGQMDSRRQRNKLRKNAHFLKIELWY